ncbi:MAG: hypothetical protein AAGD07_13120 [Planctomycetota bacterium]
MKLLNEKPGIGNVFRGMILTLILVPSVARAQGLTSQTDLGAVFDIGVTPIENKATIGPIELPRPSDPKSDPGESGRRVSVSESEPRALRSESGLSALLKASGFDATRFDTMAYEFEIERDIWTIPVLLLVDVEDQRVDLVALLRSFDASATDRLETLEKLFDENRELFKMRYGYSVPRKRIELWYSRSGIHLSAAQLQEMVRELGDRIVDDAALWSPANDAEKGNDAKESVETVVKPDQAPRVALNNTSLTVETLAGVWTATTKSGDGFALRVATNATFALAFAAKAAPATALNTNQVATSTGRCRVVGDWLELLPKQGEALGLRIIAMKSDRMMVQWGDQQLSFRRESA